MNILSQPGDIFDQLLKFAFSDVQLEKRQRQFADKSAFYWEDVRNTGQKGGGDRDPRLFHPQYVISQIITTFFFFFLNESRLSREHNLIGNTKSCTY